MNSNSPKISLIIAFYKNFEALELIFKSLMNQKFNDFEIIIAEDDNNPDTHIFLEKWKKKLSHFLKHVNQAEKIGFRKTMTLNKALKVSSGKIIVFIDGDIILHKNFLRKYSKFVKSNNFCTGRRVMLSSDLTKKLYTTKNLKFTSYFRILFSKSKKKKFILLKNNLIPKKTKKGIVGANWGIMKENLIRINGFDEDYIQAGVGEDTDVRWRLVKNGLQNISLRYSAIVFHLYHERFYSSSDTKKGFEILEKKQESNLIICKNGLKKLKNDTTRNGTKNN